MDMIERVEKARDEQRARAERAEARITELEKERDEWKDKAGRMTEVWYKGTPAAKVFEEVKGLNRLQAPSRPKLDGPPTTSPASGKCRTTRKGTAKERPKLDALRKLGDIDTLFDSFNPANPTEAAPVPNCVMVRVVRSVVEAIEEATR